MLCVTLRSHPPTHIPVLKAPKGEGSSPFLRSLPRGLVGSFASSFIHSLVHSFYSSRLHPSTWPHRAAPLGSGLTHPPRARPRPLPAPAPSLGQSRPAGRAGPEPGWGLALPLPTAAPAAPETRRGAAGLSRVLAAPWRFLPRRAWAAPAPLRRGPRVGSRWAEVSVRATRGCARSPGGCAEPGRVCGAGMSARAARGCAGSRG